jgi:tetratricopeptide (TPR) repeat protein
MTRRQEVNAPRSEGWVVELQRRPAILGALLVLSTLLLYGQTIHHEFLTFDDGPYVTQNVHVNTGLTLTNVVWAFTTFHEANWHPLTWLSHMLDCQLFGLQSGPPHLENVALHAVNALLLFLLLREATGAVWQSWWVAALFAVHPLNVETVAWVAQRKSLLSTLFFLLTIFAYGWYVQRPNWTKYLVMVGTFSLALMAKPVAVSLPVVLLLLDYWPLQRDRNSRMRAWLRLTVEKLPLLFMAALSSWITIVAQLSGGALAERTALPLSVRAGNALVSYAGYFAKTFWPAKLAVFYVHAEESLAWADVLVSAAVLIVITVVVVYFRHERYLLTGWFFFVVTLIPVIGIVQVGRQAMADRYAYIPCIGLFIMVGWGLGALVQAALIPRAAAAVAALCVVAGFAFRTTRYLRYWQNGVSLFTQASLIAGRPDPALEEALGDSLLAAGRFEEAFRHYRETCILQPQYAFCHYNMAEILYHRRQLRDALEQYQIALRLTKNREIALSCLLNSGEILMKLGDYPSAERQITGALLLDPNNSAALRLRDQLFEQRGQPH